MNGSFRGGSERQSKTAARPEQAVANEGPDAYPTISAQSSCRGLAGLFPGRGASKRGCGLDRAVEPRHDRHKKDDRPPGFGALDRGDDHDGTAGAKCYRRGAVPTSADRRREWGPTYRNQFGSHTHEHRGNGGSGGRGSGYDRVHGRLGHEDSPNRVGAKYVRARWSSLPSETQIAANENSIRSGG